MSSPGSDRSHIDKPILLVCDARGRIQAMTSVDACDRPQVDIESSLAPAGELAEAIRSWLDERIPEARACGDYSSETTVENGDSHLLLRLESLMHGRELYGFALHILPYSACGARRALRDGDSIVERRQWHEIKNHVGALKLYATFLKRQMPDGDERRIVEKIITGVNALIGYLDKVRRGEAQ